MRNIGMTLQFESPVVAAAVLICTLSIGIAFALNSQSKPGAAASQRGKVLGLAFKSVRVSDLEKATIYYQALGFAVAGDPDPPWIKNEAANRLYNTPGAMSRTATLTIPSTNSGRPFTLYLREYKNAGGRGRIDFPPRHPSSTHFGLMVPEADNLWAKLRASGLLRPLSWDGKLIRMPGQASASIAYIRDADGFNVEIIGVSPSDQAKGPTLHHIGHAVLNSARAKAFYGDLLGAKFPDKQPEWFSGDMYDAPVGGHGYVLRFFNGAFPEAAAPQTTMNLELVEYQKPDRTEIGDYAYADIAVSCVGFEVEGIDALYARLKAAGIRTWSQGGIVLRSDGVRAVVVRDPDVGVFIELFEKPRR